MAESTDMTESRGVREKRPPKSHKDYISYSVTCSSEPSEGSSSGSNMSDTEENSEQEQALLNRITTWQRVMAKLEAKMDKESSVCDWTTMKNDAIIKKYFKVRRKFLSPYDLACRYFWHGEDTFYDKWVTSSDVQNLLSFLRLATSCVDTKETDLFFPHGGRAASFVSQVEISDAIGRAVNDTDSNILSGKSLLDRVEKPSFRPIARRMFEAVREWLLYLGEVVKANPAATLECVFEELTRNLLNIFLVCRNGKTKRFTLPDSNKECQPDLIFAQNSLSPYWGVVEVKRMDGDPAFKHFFKRPKKGIMNVTESKDDSPSVEEDESIPAKKRRVTYLENDNENHEDDDSAPQSDNNSLDDDSSLLDNDSHDAVSALPEYVRDTVDTFFSQLYGQIISLDSYQPSRRNRRMGIGVVGFRIFFLAFYAKPGVPFARIPETKGAKTEVHIAGPLCILNANDRDDIARILLLLAEGRPV